MGKGNIIAGLVLLVLLVGGAYALTNSKSVKTNNGASKQNQSQSTSTNGSSITNTESTNVITYDGTSFSPSTLTVKSGDKITIKDTSAKMLQFDSDPHPIHTDDTDLNIGTVAAGESQTFTVSQKGTFGYHNHLNPAQRGQITVE